MQSLVRELGLDGAVDFAGSLSEDEVIRRLHAADAFVLASRSDPRPVVVMEALALGLPVIGTDAGGIPEIVTSERMVSSSLPRTPMRLQERLHD